MFCEGKTRSSLTHVPNINYIVISSRCQSSTIIGPFKATNLLSMLFKHSELMIIHSNIMMQNSGILIVYFKYSIFGNVTIKNLLYFH